MSVEARPPTQQPVYDSSSSEYRSVNRFNLVRLEEEANYVNAKGIPDGFPDVYVNGEEGTVTVDPPGFSQWVRDDVYGHRHAITMSRGALLKHEAVESLAGNIDRDNYEPPPVNFIPTSAHLDALPKFSGKSLSNSTRGVHKNPVENLRKPWQRGKYGMFATELPIFTKFIYEGRFRDVPDWAIELDQYYAPDRSRFFDCGGGPTNCR